MILSPCNKIINIVRSGSSSWIKAIAKLSLRLCRSRKIHVYS